MVFSGIEFLLYFLPVFMIVYAVTPLKLRGGVLLTGSIVFYVIGAGSGSTLLFLCLIAVNYFGAFWISSVSSKGRKAVLALLLAADFGCLLYFKYMGFFVRELSVAFPGLPEQAGCILPAVLPLGISFFVFQLAAYLIDVYRNEIQAERNILIFANYNMAFPKLLMGPICRFGQMKQDLERPQIHWREFEQGLTVFVAGLALKVIIADRLSPVWMDIQTIGYESISAVYAWIGIVCYTLQLYFDFSGYSMMAMGLGRMIGLDIPRNFDLPYTSRSVSEFYRSWHMTLGQWFRDYIYIPMGGNRKGTGAVIFNLAAVWVITGLWHGDSWNFLIWGLYLLAFILLEKFVIGGFLKRHTVCSHIYTVFVILMSWVIFAITDVREIGVYFSRLFPVVPTGYTVYEYDYLLSIRSCWWAILAGIILCMPFGRKLFEKYMDRTWLKAVMFILFWISVYMVLRNTGNPFMYLQF